MNSKPDPILPNLPLTSDIARALEEGLSLLNDSDLNDRACGDRVRLSLARLGLIVSGGKFRSLDETNEGYISLPGGKSQYVVYRPSWGGWVAYNSDVQHRKQWTLYFDEECTIPVRSGKVAVLSPNHPDCNNREEG